MLLHIFWDLFPTRQVEMADKLDLLKNEKGV